MHVMQQGCLKDMFRQPFLWVKKLFKEPLQHSFSAAKGV